MASVCLRELRYEAQGDRSSAVLRNPGAVMEIWARVAVAVTAFYPEVAPGKGGQLCGDTGKLQVCGQGEPEVRHGIHSSGEIR